MLSLRKGGSNPEELTFKARVEQFWQWFAQVAPRFCRMMEEEKLRDVTAETGPIVENLFPDFAWVFETGAAGACRSFTLSGESVLQRQLLAIYWASRAPRLDGWTFHSSRQPSPPEIIDVITMNFEGREVRPMEFWVVPTIDDEEEKLNLTVWHPHYADVPEEDRRIGAFLVFLDEVLGEHGTTRRIGTVKASDDQLTDAIPLTELSTFIQKLETEKAWQSLPPGERGEAYERDTHGNRFLRDDVYAGTSTQYDLIVDYYEAEGNLEDPLAGTGADYLFVSIDRRSFPDTDEVEVWDVTESALQSALESEQSGRVLGGAFGMEFAYVDLMVFDGTNSIQIVERVLREQNLPAGTTISFFAREKISRRVVL